jgi:hypothetical protein
VKGAQEYIPIVSAPGKRIPKYHAQALTAALCPLLSGHSAQNATPHKSSSLNLMGEGENYLSISIVSPYRLADLPIVPEEILA